MSSTPSNIDSAQPTEISRSSGVDPSNPEGVNNATTHVLQSSTPINADDTSATTPRGVKRDRSEQSPHEDKDSVDAVYVSKRPKTISTFTPARRPSVTVDSGEMPEPVSSSTQAPLPNFPRAMGADQTIEGILAQLKELNEPLSKLQDTMRSFQAMLSTLPRYTPGPSTPSASSAPSSSYVAPTSSYIKHETLSSPPRYRYGYWPYTGDIGYSPLPASDQTSVLIPNFTNTQSAPSTSSNTNNSSAHQVVWGWLIPQVPENHTPIYLKATQGRPFRCDLAFRDKDTNDPTTNHIIRLFYHPNSNTTTLECLADGIVVTVNKRLIRRGIPPTTIRSGDEITVELIRPRKRYEFIFQQLSANDSIPLTTSQPRKLRLHCKFSPSNSSENKQNSDSVGNAPKVVTPAMASEPAPPTRYNDTEEVQIVDVIQDAQHDSGVPMSSIDIPRMLVPTARHMIPPSVLPPDSSNGTSSFTMPAAHQPASNVPNANPEISEKDIPFIAEEPSTVNDLRDRRRKEMAELRARLKKHFQQSILRPEQNTTSFDKFPYYLSDSFKESLMHSVHVFLECPEFTKFTLQLQSMSRRLLLFGDPGTELLQETLLKALAKHFNANLLIVDPSSLHVADSASTTPDDALDPELQLSSSEPILSQPSRPHALRVGDRVRYVGGSPFTTPPLPTLSDRILRCLPDPLSGSQLSRREKSRGPPFGATGRVVIAFDDNPKKVGVRFDKPIPGGTTLGNLCEDRLGYFIDVADLRLENDDIVCATDVVAVETLFEVVGDENNQPIILLLKNVDKLVLANYERSLQWKKDLEKMGGRSVAIGSLVVTERRKDKPPNSFMFSKSGGQALIELSYFSDHFLRGHEERSKDIPTQLKVLLKLFPSKLRIIPPDDPAKLIEWEKRIEKDVQKMKADTNIAAIKKVLEKNNIECPKVNPKPLMSKVLSSSQVEKVVGWAVSHHLMTHKTDKQAEESSASKDDTQPPPKLVLSPQSLDYGIRLLMSFKTSKPRSIADIETDNEFEKRLLADVIPPSELNVKFDDIGALDKVKDTLRELVMLPLQRPELFRRGNLAKPCKGILLFGPPGTGKTMLAKAVATESGANFINISMASIGSKWFGESEKYARAIFTLASKIAPAVIFIDEVDSLLGRRDKSGEHEAMRKLKNELMAMWDGLRSSENERVLVLAATNRPFDLDDAVLRRLPRRLLVDLPDAPNRKKIFKVVLAHEELGPDIDLDELARISEGYSGSDIKHLCVAAAYQPIRELLEKEKQERLAKGEAGESSGSTTLPSVDSIDDMDIDEIMASRPVALRPLRMADFRAACQQVAASVSEDAASIAELRKWNESYGDGGSRSKPALPYFM